MAAKIPVLGLSDQPPPAPPGSGPLTSDPCSPPPGPGRCEVPRGGPPGGGQWGLGGLLPERPRPAHGRARSGRRPPSPARRHWEPRVRLGKLRLPRSDPRSRAWGQAGQVDKIWWSWCPARAHPVVPALVRHLPLVSGPCLSSRLLQLLPWVRPGPSTHTTCRGPVPSQVPLGPDSGPAPQVRPLHTPPSPLRCHLLRGALPDCPSGCLVRPQWCPR